MIGKRLGHNRVVEKIGEGGMGVVYRALDEHLNRDVAIKVFPARTLTDESARKRFRREADALSKLNHPSVETVFDFDSEAGVDYLVLEYVAGVTLRQVLEPGPLHEKEALRLGIQIAEGLAAAHERGIVHCDLKPDNVMVTAQGQAKILDFGLALLTKPEMTKDSTDSSSHLGSGGGTVPYMAPEQLCGERVDHRTDIYGFGNLLYELSTGRRPFQGTLATALANDILHKPVTLPCRINPGLSPRVEEIILKCLEKDPDSRYQSAKEILVDLRRSMDPISHPAGTAGFRRGKRIAPATAVLVAAVIVLASAALMMWPRKQSRRPVPSYEPKRVTSATGWQREPAISPDGNYIAYAANRSGNVDIYVTHVREGWEKRLTSDPASDSEPAWFPDNSIAFTSDRPGRAGIWRISLLSGIETPLVQDASYPAVSVDGTMLAFVKQEAGGHFKLMTAPTDDPGNAAEIDTGADSEWKYLCPAWSPDARRLCFSTSHNLWTVAASGGQPLALTIDDERDYEPAWSPDGRHVYFRSNRGGTFAIWRVSADGGVPERVTSGALEETHPSLSRDGALLVHSSATSTERLVLRDCSTAQMSTLTIEDARMGAISPDKTRIAFVRDLLRPDITLWVQLVSGGHLKGAPYSLAGGLGLASLPAFSPDGLWIAFSVLQDKQMDVWVIPTSGGQRVRFTQDPAFDSHASWSPDGRSIAFSSRRRGSARIWIAPVRDGKPAGPPSMVHGIDVDAFFPVWAPDAAQVAFLGEVAGRFDIWVAPVDGRHPARRVTNSADVNYIRWGRTDGLLASGKWGSRRLTLRRVSTETGESVPYPGGVDFGEDDTGVFDISSDGAAIVVSRKDPTDDVWLLKAVNGTF